MPGLSQYVDLFQFTPLREGRRRAVLLAGFMFPFQFTPLREGRLASQVASRIGRSISIHAPPRGATGVDYRLQKIRLFQFTPLREGRLSMHGMARSCIIFQFTPLREGRLTALRPHPTRSNFNSRPSARGDSFGDCKPSDVAGFQFTPLREGRRLPRYRSLTG